MQLWFGDFHFGTATVASRKIPITQLLATAGTAGITIPSHSQISQLSYLRLPRCHRRFSMFSQYPAACWLVVDSCLVFFHKKCPVVVFNTTTGGFLSHIRYLPVIIHRFIDSRIFPDVNFPLRFWGISIFRGRTSQVWPGLPRGHLPWPEPSAFQGTIDPDRGAPSRCEASDERQHLGSATGRCRTLWTPLVKTYSKTMWVIV